MMIREQAKIWSKLSKAELRAIGRDDLAEWHEVMEHFANGGWIEYETMGAWCITENPMFGYEANFRIKPKTHIVNGFEVPAPIKEYTGQEVVYIPHFLYDNWSTRVDHDPRAIEKLINRRAAFETREAARANSMAMLGIDPSTYKEQAE